MRFLRDYRLPSRHVREHEHAPRLSPHVRQDLLNRILPLVHVLLHRHLLRHHFLSVELLRGYRVEHALHVRLDLPEHVLCRNVPDVLVHPYRGHGMHDQPEVRFRGLQRVLHRNS